MQRNHPLCRPVACLLSAIGSLFIPCCSAAWGQNLVMQPQGAPAYRPASPAQPTPPSAPGTPGDAAPAAPVPPASAAIATTSGRGYSGTDQLQGVSLFVVTAPAPKKFTKHDVVEVIINELSAESFTQTTDFKKDYTLQAKLSQFPSLQALLSQGTLTNGIGAVQPAVGMTGNKETKGNGKIDRKDSVTEKISAFVVDVKPNGNLVLEARKSRVNDKETTTVVLSGTCRADDITKNNTIQSNQLAGLEVRFEHSGDVKESGEKGIIPRILEAVFNF